MRFRTYDLEWIPGSMRLRVAGEFDGKRYWAHKSIEAFLDHALTHANSGTVWFAHAGGLADVQFILEALVASKRYAAKVVLSGSSAIMVRVNRLDANGIAGRDSWTFADSYWILRSPLKKIGEAIGIPKLSDYRCPGGCDHEPGHCVFYAPEGVLLTYNEQDCRILHVALERLQDSLLAMGGALKKTLASCAMHLFRSRYLRREIPTFDSVNRTGRSAYVASRVEVFRPAAGKANYYDVNSSFPYSMTLPQPGRMVALSRQLPDSGLYLATLTVSVPDMYLPPLPYRGPDKRIYFPVGSWQGTFTQADVEYLLEKGGKIVAVHSVSIFEPFDDLRAYALDLYERKASAPDEFTRLLYKLLLNSLYGKFAEREEKRNVIINPPRDWPYWNIADMISPGIFALDEASDVPHAHVPIAANITSLSRALLGRYLDQAAILGEIYYADTDSVVTTATLPNHPSALGELKLEKTIERGTFLAPKLYRIEGEHTTVRAKGFRRLTDSDFDRVAAGEAVEITRMRRFRENAKRGNLTPNEHKATKRFIGKQRPKRAPDGRNNTRPWNVQEVEGCDKL